MHNQKYQVMGFIDDSPAMIETSIFGYNVYSLESCQKLIPEKKIQRIFLAIPSAVGNTRRHILNRLLDFHVEVKTIPNFDDIVEGKAIDDVKDIPISDLLGRFPVLPQDDLMAVRGQVVMVTGAGGSIGSELCRQILENSPSTLILFEISEFSLYQIHKELEQIQMNWDRQVLLIPLLGSVQQFERLESVMRSYSVETLYHAAAYKHVPLVEHNVIEGIRNNVFGTYNTAKAAISAKVKNFVLISTDKAVRPTNVMGTTKRMAELGLQALAEQQNHLNKREIASTRLYRKIWQCAWFIRVGYPFV